MTSTDGSSGLAADHGGAEPLSLAEQVQPGLTKTFRLVFDVNPAVKNYTFGAAGNKFALNLA
jgi:hypothetical protein